MSSVAAAKVAQYGIENKFIRGDLSTTYFKAVYNRHTNFAVQPMKVNFESEVSLGTVNILKIPRNGDLIKEITIRMELPQLVKLDGLDADYDNVYPVWTNSITEAIVEKAELVIGGQTIQSLTGEMSFIKSELETTESQYEALQKITNRNMSGGNTTVNDKYANQISQGTVFMEMRFYFHKHPALSIPLVALDKQEVEIHLTLQPFFSLINAYRDAVVYKFFGLPADEFVNEEATGPIKFIPFVDYIFLDDMEKGQFTSGKQHDYLIEQTQFFQPAVNVGLAATTTRFMLPFKHLVKELFLIFIQTNRYEQKTQYGNSVFLFSNFLKTAELSFNGEIRLSNEIGDDLYLRKYQPMTYHTRVASSIYTYSFATEPESIEPTGSVNFNRISKVLMSLNSRNTNGTEREIHVHATSWNVLRICKNTADLLFK